MDNGALLVIEEQELVKKTVKFIKTGENACEKCYFHDHGHCPWDCDDGYYVEHNPSNWHTGTPTEEGWYLIAYKPIEQDSPLVYYTWHQWRDAEGYWQSDGSRPNEFWKQIAWQKIEPYKED